MSDRMRIEMLYFDGCPSYQELLPRLKRILLEERIDEQIDERRVDSLEDAEAEHFLGSPTVRVDGRDVDPSADARDDYGFKCRLYRSSTGVSGLPPDDWIRAAVVAARP